MKVGLIIFDPTMIISFVNLSSWLVGKCKDTCNEMKEANFDVLTMAQTNLKESF